MKKWFEIKAMENGETEVYLFDEIGGWGVNARDFIGQLKQIQGKIKLLINSPGGSLFEGLSIYNYIQSINNRVEVTVLGIAASAASIIALAGSKLTMYESSYLMIHNVWAGVAGDSKEIRRQADIMDKLNETIIGIYEAKSTLKTEEIRKLMDDETYINSKDALAYGMVSEVILDLPMSACITSGNLDLSKMPDGLKARIQAQVTEEPKAEEAPVIEEPLTEKPNVEEPQEPAQENNSDQETIQETQEEKEPEYKKDEEKSNMKIEDLENKADLANIGDKVGESKETKAAKEDLELFKNSILTKGKEVYKNTALGLTDGYGVPTALGGEILRNRDRASHCRGIARNMKVANLTKFTASPNTGAAEVVTGAYPDLTSAGTAVTATPSKVGGRYLAKEEVNDYSVLNVMEQFKIDAARALAKGENALWDADIIATASTKNVGSGAWTQAKIAAMLTTVSSDYIGTPGFFLINAANLPSLMSIQVNGAGSPLLFTPSYLAEDGRVGTMYGYPVFVSSAVSSAASGAKLLWFVAGDALVIVDFLNGNLTAKIGEDQSTNDLFINFKEDVFFDVIDANGVCSLTFA